MLLKITEALQSILINNMEKDEILSYLKNDETDLIETFGLDSLLRVQFIIEIEEIFNIEIDIEELDISYFKNCGLFKKMISSYIS